MDKTLHKCNLEIIIREDRIDYLLVIKFDGKLAERTGIEPATSCVTGRHSNHLNYRSALNKSLAVTYSHTNVRCTTIGVTAFHFCVRNGNRWFYSTMAARQIGFKT